MNIYTRQQSEPLEKKLQEFYKRSGKKFEAPNDIFKYGNDLGFTVWKMPLDEEALDGIIYVRGETKKRIGINKSLELNAARFVLAHELAHYIHRYLTDDADKLWVAEKDRIFHGDEKEQIEHDMDYLAAAMLVPKEDFILDLKKYSFDFDKFVDKAKQELRRDVSEQMIKELSAKYYVDEPVISRRIVEVSYYV